MLKIFQPEVVGVKVDGSSGCGHQPHLLLQRREEVGVGKEPELNLPNSFK